MSTLATPVRHAAALQVLLDYCVAVDAGDTAGVCELFTDDVVADYGSGPVRHGRAELEALVTTLRGSCERTSHHLSNLVVHDDGPGRLRARSAIVAWHLLRDGSTLLILGRYDDVLRQADDGWRIARRALRVHGSVPPGTPFARVARWPTSDTSDPQAAQPGAASSAASSAS